MIEIIERETENVDIKNANDEINAAHIKKFLSYMKHCRKIAEFWLQPFYTLAAFFLVNVYGTWNCLI